jgi:NitT/TauT family transport system permease protein
VQGLRSISPIAWLPVAILWFGIGDEAAIFIIFLTSFFTLVTGTMTAVRTIPEVYIRSARNFGVKGLELFRRVVFPAALPQIITSIRIALGVGWIVVVAAEMLGVNSGLGYMVMDARNMGMRYDLVVGAMICIGLIGILIDVAVRRLERMDEVRWGFSKL